MSKKFYASDFAEPEKPHISVGRWQFGARVYTHRCKGPTSCGYGTTPLDAWNAWNRNYTRRKKFYVDRDERAQASILRFERRFK